MTITFSRRRKGLTTARAVVILVILALIPLATHAVTLKIATLAPDGTRWMQAMRSAGSAVEQQTEGRVKMRFYPGGVMGNDRSVLRKMRVGQLHGGAITAGGLAALFPDIQIYSLPFAFESFEELDYVRGRMDAEIITGLRKKRLISFGLSENGFAYLMSQAPIKTLGDLQDHKVWSPEGDTISRLAFEALDVSTIPLPLTDVLTGLQTSLIDTVAGSPVGAIALQWHTRVRYLTDVPLIYLYATLVIQERTLNKISPSDRKTLEGILRKAQREVNDGIRRDYEAARDALQKQGIEFVTPDQDALAEWRREVGDAVQAMGRDGLFSLPLWEQIQALKREFRNQ